MKYFVVYFIVFIISALIPYCFYYVHKKYDHSLEYKDRSLLATNLGFFNALYAFLLGFAVVTLWSHYMNAQDTIAKESQAITTMYRVALMLPDSKSIRHTIKKYNESIVKDEWSEMNITGKISLKTQRLLHHLWYKVKKYNPKTETDWEFYKSLIDKIQDVSEFRTQRFITIENHLYPPMWFIIVIGAVFSLICFYFTSTEKITVQLLFDFIFIFMIILTIWLISELNTPFNGILRISPEPFNIVKDRMTIIDDNVKDFINNEKQNTDSSSEEEPSSTPSPNASKVNESEILPTVSPEIKPGSLPLNKGAISPSASPAATH